MFGHYWWGSVGIYFQTKIHLGSTCVQVGAILRKVLGNENQWRNSIHHSFIQKEIQLLKQECVVSVELPLRTISPRSPAEF